MTEFRSTCNCGWTGRWHGHGPDAHIEYGHHVNHRGTENLPLRPCFVRFEMRDVLTPTG